MAVAITNNGGRKSDKHWRDALIIAAKRTEDETVKVLSDPKAPMIAKAAAQVAFRAASGDKDAYKELGDRIDGKPHVSMDVTTNNERNPAEWTEGELDGEIARLRAARIAGGKAASGSSASKPH